MPESVKCNIRIGSQPYATAYLGGQEVEIYYHESTKKLYITPKK